MPLQKFPKHLTFPIEKLLKNMSLKLKTEQMVVKARQMLRTSVSSFIIIFFS